MLKKTLITCSLLLASCQGGTVAQTTNQTINPQEVDVWYGPGYYYGTWFDTEDAYWGWRGNHLDYPANVNYYNRNYPVNYNRNNAQENRAGDRGDAMNRGGGGGHAGGGGGHGR